MSKHDLKKTHLARVLEACEMIETGEERYTCIAIEFGRLRNGKSGRQMSKLLDRYAAFYERNKNWVWFSYEDDEEVRNQRIMAMLFFAHVEGRAKL